MIRVTLSGAAVGTGAAAALPRVSAGFATGTVTLLATEGGTRQTVLSLVASGRMKLDAGSVSAVDEHGRTMSPARLRRAVALVDTPLVAEHSDEVSIASVVKEELAMARGRSRGTRPAEITNRRPFGSLSGEARLALLTELVLLRPDVEALVITAPERHGGEPAAWWRLLRDVATGRRGGPADGVAVLVVTDHATVTHIERLPEWEPLGVDALPLFEFDVMTSLESTGS
ncbi:MAG: hypothetical protein HIU88_00330 [Acidobacteria bacterium]|nr:hypothetical protein [Acidobacteriota bacterium]